MNFLVNFLITVVVIIAAPSIIDGVRVRSTTHALAVALVFGVLNLLIGWLLTALLGLAVTVVGVLTLGLGFLLYGFIGGIVYTVLFILTDKIIDGFQIDRWSTALILGFLLAIVQWLVLTVIK